MVPTRDDHTPLKSEAPDYLIDAAPRRPFRSAEDVLGERLATIAELATTTRACRQLHRRPRDQDPPQGPGRRNKLNRDAGQD